MKIIAQYAGTAHPPVLSLYIHDAPHRRMHIRVIERYRADLRGALVAGADLRHALFVTQPQLDAARGDAETRVPAHLRRPSHWSAAR